MKLFFNLLVSRENKKKYYMHIFKHPKHNKVQKKGTINVLMHPIFFFYYRYLPKDAQANSAS